MENLEIIYREYVRLSERYNYLLDSSFNDIKLYGVLGSVIGLIGISKKSGIDLIIFNQSESKIYFLIILLMFFLVSIIAFRDLLKQVYIVHLSYNIKKIEDHLQSKYDESLELFNLRKSWTEKYYSLMKSTYSAFMIIFFFPIIVLPIYLFYSDNKLYGVITSAIMIVTLIIYSILIYRIYETAKNNEQVST